MPADNKYLKRRGQTWSVVVHVPKKLQEAAGCSEFVKALGTRDIRVAQRQRHRWIAEFKERIETLRDVKSDPLAERALWFRQRLERQKGKYSRNQDGEIVTAGEELHDELLAFAKEVLLEDGERAADRFYKTATGEVELLKDFLPVWQQDHEGKLGIDTIKVYCRVLQEFLDWAGSNVTVEEIDRRKAGAYVTHLATATGRASASVATYVNKLSGFWRWLAEKGFTESSNPWRGHRISRSNTVQKRRALSDSELVDWLTIKDGGKYQALYHDIIRLILVTGLRVEEACQLGPEDIEERDDGRWLIVRKGKTAAAARAIPLRDEAVQVLTPRMGGQSLFDEIETTAKRRSSVVTGAFSDVRKRQGFGKIGQNFHVLRNTFAAAMEGEGVPVTTVQLLMGHKRPGMTYGHYSKGERVDLRDAVERLQYGEEVMRLLKE